MVPQHILDLLENDEQRRVLLKIDRTRSEFIAFTNSKKAGCHILPFPRVDPLTDDEKQTVDAISLRLTIMGIGQRSRIQASLSSVAIIEAYVKLNRNMFPENYGFERGEN